MLKPGPRLMEQELWQSQAVESSFPGGCEPALGATGTVYSVHTVLLLCQLPSGFIPPLLAAVLKLSLALQY